MNTRAEQAPETGRLRDCLNDLVSVMALSALWPGRDPLEIVTPVADALLEMLHLSFVLVRLKDPEGGQPIEIARVDESFGRAVHARDITAAVDSALVDRPSDRTPGGRLSIGAVDLALVSADLGLAGALGVVIVASQDLDFPAQTERLIFDVAVNQAAIGLQQAQLLRVQKRIARELDERVAQRTKELATANNALREREQDLRLMVDSIPGLVALLDATGELEVVNRQILEYSGRTLEELQRWATDDTVHVEDLPHVAQIFSQSIATGNPYDIVHRLRRFDGVYRWFRNRGLPVRDINGHVVRWCVLLTDIDDQKRAEDAIRTSERDLKLIIDTIPALAWSARPDGSAEFFNQHYLDFTGLSAEEAVDWGWTAAAHPEDVNGLATTWQQIMASGGPGEAEARLRRHDGEYRWFLFRAHPLRDGKDTIVKWYGVNTDIEDRKRAEQELRRSETFLAQAQRLTLTGSLWWKSSTGDITWSDESYRLMGYPKTVKPTVELILNRVHPEDRSRVREMVDRSARERTNMDFEHRLLMPDGSIKHVHVVVQNVAAESSPPEFVGAVTDITERKCAEAELRRAYDHLSEAQRLSQTGSFTSDLERNEDFYSDEFYRIFEFEPGSPITRQRIRDIVHPEDVLLYEGLIGRAMAGTDPDFYFRIVTSRGVVKHLRGFAHRIAERPVYVGAVQDVTASKMAQEALNRAGAELAHVSRVTALSALTASIAHEVNQPLSGIITNAGTCLRMLDGVPPDIDGARETARRTIRDGNRASDVITRLRALFSKREFTLEPLDLNEATREVIALSSNDLQRIRIILRSDLAGGLPMVTGDRIQLQQVILNLIRNASDAMVDVRDRPRQLLIKTEHDDDDCVRLTVRDVGVGLPTQSLNSVFDAFYTTKNGGMGIGLFVSRSIIERHQGRLWAEPNDSGPGATFSFSLPREPQSLDILPMETP
jgi:PAS domain S-box-containing protein